MKSPTLLPLFTALTAGLATACGGTEAGTATQIKLALGSVEAPNATSGNDPAGTTFVVESASAHVRDIELDLPDGRSCAELTAEELGSIECDSGSDKLRIEGPFEIDLVTGEANPSLDNVTIPAGVYKRVDVRFDDAREDEGLVDASSPLVDNTLVAEGSFSYQDEAARFSLVLKFNEDARFEDSDGVEVGESTPSDILLWLDVSKWFSALPITECLDDGSLEMNGGSLAIADDGGSCSDIENTIKDTIKSSGQLDKNE